MFCLLDSYTLYVFCRWNLMVQNSKTHITGSFEETFPRFLGEGAMGQVYLNRGGTASKLYYMSCDSLFGHDDDVVREVRVLEASLDEVLLEDNRGNRDTALVDENSRLSLRSAIKEDQALRALKGTQGHVQHQGLSFFTNDGDLFANVEMNVAVGKNLYDFKFESFEQRMVCARQVVRAARDASYCGVIMPDIKPENCHANGFIYPIETVLLDHSLSYTQNPRGWSGEVFSDFIKGPDTGCTFGTPGYMSPEQINESFQEKMGINTNLYGAGLMCVYILTDEEAVKHHNCDAVMLMRNMDSYGVYDRARGLLENLRDVPEGVVQGVMGLLETNPRSRDATAFLEHSLSYVSTIDRDCNDGCLFGSTFSVQDPEMLL